MPCKRVVIYCNPGLWTITPRCHKRLITSFITMAPNTAVNFPQDSPKRAERSSHSIDYYDVIVLNHQSLSSMDLGKILNAKDKDHSD